MYSSMVGCMSAFLVDHDVMIGDVTNSTQYSLSQGFSDEKLNKTRVAWTCPTESVVNRDLLRVMFATKSLSAGWRMFCDWFMPKTMAEQVKWSVSFDSAKMETGEEPMKYFRWIDKIVGVLASLGVVKSVADVNRKIIMTLTSDYEIEERTILYREDVTRAEIESIIRQRYLRLPRKKGRDVGQAIFSNGPARGGRAGRGRHRSNGVQTGESHTASKNSQGSSSSIPQAPTHNPPLSVRQSEGKMFSLLGNRAHLVPVKGSHPACTRADIKRRCARPEQRR